jgi:hypothetical protein
LHFQFILKHTWLHCFHLDEFLKRVKNILLCVEGLQKVGEATRRGASPAGHHPHARPALFPQLRPDLVRLDAAGGRANQDPLLGALTGAGAGAGAALQLQGLFQGLQLPARLAHAPRQEMLCVVIQIPILWFRKNRTQNKRTKTLKYFF